MTFHAFDQSDESLWPDKLKEQWQRHDHLHNTLKEQPYIFVTFETFAQSHEETWHEQEKDNDNYDDKDKVI